MTVDYSLCWHVQFDWHKGQCKSCMNFAYPIRKTKPVEHWKTVIRMAYELLFFWIALDSFKDPILLEKRTHQIRNRYTIVLVRNASAWHAIRW